MELEKRLKGYNGDEFSFRVTPKSEITLFEGGYLITPDGEFVTVKRGEKHARIFNAYLNLYLGKSRDRIVSNYLGVSEDSEEIDNLDFLTVYGLLISLNHVIYSGFGISDDNDIVSLFLPYDYQSVLAEEQKGSCVLFFLSERLENIDVKICLWNSEIELSVDDFLNSISNGRGRKS